MMEDLTMLDAIYTTDAEMADYDFDYDIPESVMQDEPVPATASSFADDFDYSSAQVQEYDMLEDGLETFGTVIPPAETVIEAEPLTITAAPIAEPASDVVSVLHVETVPENIITPPTLTSPPPTTSQDLPFPTVTVVTPPDSSITQVAPVIPVTPQVEPSTTSADVASSELSPPIEQPESLTLESKPQHDANQEPQAPLSSTLEDNKVPSSTTSHHSEDAVQNLAESIPNDSPPSPEPQPADNNKTTLMQATSSPPNHQPVIFYHSDQPYQLFSALSASDQALSQDDNLASPSVLLSGQSELFAKPLALLFNTIREQEKANFSWISDQYLIGLEYQPLELYIDESSVYANEVSLADLCNAVKACGHDLMEFTLYQADDFKYLLHQRLQGIPPPLPEGSSESQEEEDDEENLEFHTQQIVDTQDDQYSERSPVIHEANIVPTVTDELPVVEPSEQTTHETEGNSESDDEDGLGEVEYEEHHPTQVTSEENQQVDEEQEHDLDRIDLNQNEAPADADAQHDETVDVAELHEELTLEQDGPDHTSAVVEQNEEQLDDASAAQDAHSLPNDESEYPDDGSDGTLESSEHDVEEYANGNEGLDYNREADDTSNPNQPLALNPNEAPTSDDVEQNNTDTTSDDVGPLPDTLDLVQGPNAYDEGNLDEWRGTEPSAEGSVVPDDFDEYSYYDEAAPEYEEDESTEDHGSLPNLAEEASADRASLIDFKEEVIQINREPASPPGKGKRTISEIDEAFYESQYTDQDPHAEPKRARVE